MRRLVDAWHVAVFDFVQATKTKKALVLLVLYLTGALGGTAIFIKTLKAVEDALADTLVVAKTAKAGAMTATLFQSEQFRRVVTGLVGDRRLALSLIETPPLALFYGWFALAVIPLVAVLSSCDAVSAEVASGSCRYVLVRCDRLSFALGKLASQTTQMLVGIVLGAVASELLGAVYLSHFTWLDTTTAMFAASLRACVYGLAYLGVGIGASLAMRSVGGSRAVALLVLAAIGAAGGFASSNWTLAHAPVVAPTLAALLPNAHRVDLWQPGWARWPSVVMLLSLGTLYVSLGFCVFRRRDA